MSDLFADNPHVSVLVSSVLYLRMCDERDGWAPTIHALAPRSRWQPFIGVLARCADCVSLFLFDIDGEMVVEAAEVDVCALSTQDIQVVDNSVFGRAFSFSVNLERVARAIDAESEHPETQRAMVSERRRASAKSMHDRGNFSPGSGGMLDKSPRMASQRQFRSAGERRRSRSMGHIVGATFQGQAMNNATSSMPNKHTDAPSMLYLATAKACERNTWVGHLRQHAQPPLMRASSAESRALLQFRVERSLWIKIHEAQGLPRTHTVAAVMLDGHLAAQSDEGGPRWDNASYCFGGLGPLRRGVQVAVWQRARRGADAGVVGCCHVPVPMLQRGHVYDGWYPLTYGDAASADLPLAAGVRPARHRGAAKRLAKRSQSFKSQGTVSSQSASATVAMPRAVRRFDSSAEVGIVQSFPFRVGDVRIQVRYDETVVLDNAYYQDVSALLLDTDPTLISKLAAMHPLSADWLVETATKIAIACGNVDGWIESLVCHEMALRQERDPTLLFRGTSVSTRAIDTLMKVAGLDFVDRLIGDAVRNIADNEYACEVDPMRLGDSDNIDVHWKALLRLLQLLWQGIERGARECPSILRRTFASIRSATQAFYGDSSSVVQVRYSCISSFVFLRLVCPAMLSPRAFGLVARAPSAQALRTLTLLAKGIQCTANLSDFTAKEPHMQPMNGFVQHCIPQLKLFIDAISTLDGPQISDRPGNLWTVDGAHELAVFCAFIYAKRSHIRESLTAELCADSPSPGHCTTMPSSPVTGGPPSSQLSVQGVGLNIYATQQQQPRQHFESHTWTRRKTNHVPVDVRPFDAKPMPNSPAATLVSAASASTTPRQNDNAFAHNFGTPLDFIACTSMERLVRECETVHKLTAICQQTISASVSPCVIPDESF
ncbi:Ras GTPase-activating protein 1 [Coemansia sp. RSA 2706]|nr:Ras GTPase-activating protein 1 [Coemansia sp. RSA 2706]